MPFGDERVEILDDLGHVVLGDLLVAECHARRGVPGNGLQLPDRRACEGGIGQADVSKVVESDTFNISASACTEPSGAPLGVSDVPPVVPPEQQPVLAELGVVMEVHPDRVHHGCGNPDGPNTRLGLRLADSLRALAGMDDTAGHLHHGAG